MKKLIFGGLFLLAIGIGFLACKKEDKIYPIKKNNSALILKISKTFQKSQNLEKKAIDWGRVKKIISADLKGSLSGALKGATLGTLVPGLATAAGSVLGACIEGAASSLDASAKSAEIIGITPTGNNIETTNLNNPYDVVGSLHYSIMEDMLSSPNLYIGPSGINYLNYENLVFQKIANSYQNLDYAKPVFNSSEFLDDIYSHGNSQENLINFFQPNSSSMSSLSADAIQILIDYSISLESLNDPNAFMNYSINCENAVVASSLTEADKTMILSFMATARHAVGFYNQYL